jgi:hypothetical protein
MAGIEQEFINCEYACVYVNDPQRIQSETCTFFPNECVKPESIRPERLRNGTAKFNEPIAVDIAGQVLIVKKFWKLAESFLPFSRRMHRLLAGDAKKIWRSSRAPRVGHTDFQTISYEVLSNVGATPLPQKMPQRVLVADTGDANRLQPPNRLDDNRKRDVGL